MEKKWISNEEAIKQLEKEFVTFEIAEKMKKLGYDEPCFAFYSSSFAKIKAKLIIGSIVKEQKHYQGQICSAPLWQQAVEWLKRKDSESNNEEFIDNNKSIEITILEALKLFEDENNDSA